MCEMKVGGGSGGGRYKERGKGEEERSPSFYTTNRPPFPPSSALAAHTRPPTVGDIDPGGAVNGSGMESVCSRRGRPPDSTTASLDPLQPWSS